MSVTEHDLRVLDAIVTLTPRRINVPAAQVLEFLHGPDSTPSDLLELRLAVLRLERDGLVRSEASLRVEATPDGRIAIELSRARHPGSCDSAHA